MPKAILNEQKREADRLKREASRSKSLKRQLSEKEHRVSELEARVTEYDTAIRVIGDVWGREKKAIEARIKSNIRATLFPVIEKIKTSKDIAEIQTYVKIIEDRLKEMNPASAEWTQDIKGEFTPCETQVIQMIRQGKSSKEISELLKLSTKAISFHRSNIRKKLGLVNKKLNLMTYLRGQFLLP